MATYQITAPDGNKYKINAPDGATQEDVLNYAKQNYQQKMPAEPVKQSGYVENVKERASGRMDEANQTMTDLGAGNVTVDQAKAQVLGKLGAGTALDTMGETVKAGYEMLPEGFKDTVEGKAMQAWDSFSNTYDGRLALRALDKGKTAWDEWKSENPQAAKTTESLVNVGLIVSPSKVGGTPVKSVTKRVGAKASKQIAQKRGGFVADLISPKKTKKVLEQEARRTTEKGRGIFRKQTVAPSVREQQMATEVSRIKDVTPKRSLVKNREFIAAEEKKIRSMLDRDVGKSRADVTHGEMQSAIRSNIDELIEESPIIVGNLQTTASRVADKAEKIIAAHTETPIGVLKARREFDNWIKTLPRGEAKLAADATMEAQSIAIKSVRNTMNDMIDAKVKTTAVKRELKRQSILIETMENIDKKIPDASRTAIESAFRNSVAALGIRNKLTQDLALITGAGVFSAATTFAPTVSATMAGAGLLYAGGKLAVNPQTKIFLSKLLKATDKAINVSNNKSMVRQLRADRATIVEIIKSAEDSEPKTE